MKIDENDFFRQATLRISSSLDIKQAMKSCMDYLQEYIPISGMYFFVYDPNLNVVHWLASIMPVNVPEPGATFSLPQKYWDELKERFSEDAQVKIVNDLRDEPEFIQEVTSSVFPSDCSLLEMHLTGDTIIGAKFGLKEVMRMVEHVAPTDSPVLIMAESGIRLVVEPHPSDYDKRESWRWSP